jgi:hypothetical protein
MKRLSAVIALQLLYIQVALGQVDNASPVQFHGSNTLFGQYATRQGDNSEIPPSLFWNELKMTLSIYDIPVSSTFFITSEQRDFRQSINSFRIYFDAKAMAVNKARTLAMNKAKGLADENLPMVMRFMGIFNTLEFGRCRPNYTDITLRGIGLAGVNVEISPGLFYAAFSTGKVKRPIEPSNNAKPTYQREIIFGKIGIGKKNTTHFYLTYLKAADDPNSLSSMPVPDTFFVKPQENHVVGTEVMLSFAKQKFTIEGEAAASLLTRDIRSPGMEEYLQEVPGWIMNFLNPNISSSLDYAYDVKSNLTLKSTKISVGFRNIGAGYTTFGNPYLVNDKRTYQGKIDQDFAKKKISVSAFYRFSQDNLVNWKTTRTKTISYGITALVRLNKVPYFQFSYLPNYQSADRDAIKMDNIVLVITASTGYNYRIGTAMANSAFNFFYQDIETNLDTLASTCKNQTYTFNQDLALEIPLSFNAGISYSATEYSGYDKDIITYLFSATHSAFEKKWQNRLGVKWSNQVYEQNKVGLFWNSKIRLWENGDLDVRVEENIFNDNVLANNSFEEFVAQLTLGVRW